MASISVGEEDFCALATAAKRAQACGDMSDAARLDRLARKTNAALSNNQSRMTGLSAALAKGARRLRWTDVPSVLAPLDETTHPGPDQETSA